MVQRLLEGCASTRRAERRERPHGLPDGCGGRSWLRAAARQRFASSGCPASTYSLPKSDNVEYLHTSDPCLLSCKGFAC